MDAKERDAIRILKIEPNEIVKSNLKKLSAIVPTQFKNRIVKEDWKKKTINLEFETCYLSNCLANV